MQNDVNRDILSLVFAGLLKYNPQTETIDEDLATMSISGNGTVYTLTLKEGLFWHDTTGSAPHPVTADDVLFTFKTVQDPQFPNPLLRQNFQGVTVEKINDRTVRFTLEDAYSFFPSNLTLGLLPARVFEGIPIARLDQAIDFGFAPIGAGPYRVKSIIQTDLSTEVTLERFPRSLEPAYKLERIIFRIFPDFTTLLADLRNLHGLRLVPHDAKGIPIIPNRFTAREYSLPQYVALFFNLDRPIVSDQKLRLGLQLGTNKQEVVDAVGESAIVDTPLLELATADWRYKFDAESAQGALFASEWYFPEKLRLQRLLEQREANSIGPIRMQQTVLLETGSVLTVTGSVRSLPPNTRLNGIALSLDPTASGTWIVALPTTGGTGSIRMGENLMRLTDGKGRILDSAYVWRTNDPKEYKYAAEEQAIVDRFLKSKEEILPLAERISVKDLAMDGGFLRLRLPNDPVGIRRNDAGKELRLTLVTSPSPPQYQTIAQTVAAQWKKLGVAVTVDVPATRTAFEDKVVKREYDVLLFGESLLDNLDSYPYWHSSGAQHLTGNRRDLRTDAYNLGQYRSFETDALLERIRSTADESERKESLEKLQETLKRDVPAIVLYSPRYTFAHHQDILGIELGSLSLHSDRFLTLHSWYVKQNRIFPEGKSWLSFFSWLADFTKQYNEANE
jgi:ABC-type transport system substrate-binding protein